GRHRRRRPVPQHAADPGGPHLVDPRPQRTGRVGGLGRGGNSHRRPRYARLADERSRAMRTELTGSTALITGAGRGLGRAIALHLADMGAAVVAADLDAETAKATAVAVEDLGLPAMAVEMDVSDDASVTAGVDRVEREMGGFEILVNNAGVDHTVPVTGMTTEAWQQVIGVNLSGPFLLS